MDLFEALQIKALLGVLHPDDDSLLRHIFRFYSKTFNVPLPEVDALPLEDVVLAYYEEFFEHLPDEDRAEFKELLTESPEERKARQAAEKVEEAADDEFYAKLNKEVAEGVSKGPPKEKKRFIPPQQKMSATVRTKAIKDAIRGGVLEGKPQPTPAPLPEIHMDFSKTGGNLQEEVGDLDPLAPLPKK